MTGRILGLLCCLVCCLQAASGADLVYVPYHEVPRPGGEAQVLVPYERFLALWEQAQEAPVVPAEPFAAIALGPVTMTGQVEDQVLVVTVEGTIEAVGDTWSQLALPAALQLASFTLMGPDGSDARQQPLLQRDAGRLRLLVPGAGSWRWQARMEQPVIRSGDGRSQVVLHLPPAPAIRYRMPVPAAGVVVQASPAVAATVADDGAGTPMWQALLSGQEQVVLSWEAARDETAADDGPAVLLVEQRSRLLVGERSVQYETALAVDVARGRVEELVVLLPSDSTVTRVDLEGLRDWRQEEERLHLRLERPSRAAITVGLGLERVLEELPPGQEETLQIAWPQLQDARRETGWIALAASAGLRVRLSEHPELLQIDPARLDWTRDAVAAYRFLRPAPSSQLAITRLQPTLDTVVEQIVRFGQEEDALVAAIAVAVRQAGVFELGVLVDGRWELVASEGLSYEDLREDRSADGRKRLRFTLASRLLGEQTLQLRFRAAASIPRGEEGATISVPFLAIEGTRRSRGAVALAAPQSWSLQTDQRQGLAAAEVPALRRERGLDRLPRIIRDDDRYALAFTWISEDPRLTVSARPRQTELEVRQEDSFTLGDGQGLYRSRLHCTVRFAAIDQLDISLPAAVAERVTVEHPALAEQRVLPGEGPLRVLRLRFQTPQIGEQRIVLESALALPELPSGEARQFTVQPATVQGAGRSHFTVAVVRNGAIEIQVHSPLETVSPADLPAGLRREGVVAGFSGTAPAALEVEMVRHDLLDLVDASILAARYEATLTPEAMLRVRGHLLLHHRSRPYLALSLPADARLLELAVDGRSGQHSQRGEDDAVLIRLGGGQGLQTIAFIYEQRLAAEELGSMGRIAFTLPHMAADSDRLAIPVEETILQCYLPEDLRPYGFSGSLRAMTEIRERPVSSLLRFDDQAVQRKLDQPVSAGLTMRFEPRGRPLVFRRFGDGGDLSFSWMGVNLVRGVTIAGIILAVVAAWLLRRRQRMVWSVTGISALALLFAGPVWWGILLPFVVLMALGAVIGLLGGWIATWRRRRPAQASGDLEAVDWQVLAEHSGLATPHEPAQADEESQP